MVQVEQLDVDGYPVVRKGLRNVGRGKLYRQLLPSEPLGRFVRRVTVQNVISAIAVIVNKQRPAWFRSRLALGHVADILKRPTGSHRISAVRVRAFCLN